ncbi:MAG: 16S rRNA (cytosine(1402)-N(4))-methyltransferase RsmH [Pseudomonadales bacterium]|nr:16S rRNA (cytosine(1402)-N(4))-methyltransferase RsmH [Pseudomonadales bacterium]
MTAQVHKTVLLESAVASLVWDDAGFYVDGTFGRGGHAQAILAGLGPKGVLLAIDKDPEAVALGRTRFAMDPRFSIVQTSFSSLSELVQERQKAGEVAGVLLDLGVSSPQLDEAERGFSFTQDGPLDMRMNPEAGQSAAQWLAQADEKEIADIIYRYGEERHSRRMARAIVTERVRKPITSTLQLAEIVKQANPSWEKHKHPATRAFQAIRIHINQELDELQSCLQQALEMLMPKGRLVVISFHSLEDRIVKQFIDKHVRGDEFPVGVPVRHDQMNRRLVKMGKPVKAQEEELKRNPRARSAIMRVAEKVA